MSAGDLLIAYNGQTITHDAIGNPTNDGKRTYTWEHGRQLATLEQDEVTWNFTYNADGVRTKRTTCAVCTGSTTCEACGEGTSNATTYSYVYNGSSLSQMTVGENKLNFLYDANGAPMVVIYNNVVYYYVTNLQGDVIAILDSTGTAVVEYTYDAWGKLLATSDSTETGLGTKNPLRYRGYVYDNETALYYLQSRYYDPELGRFINADAFASTGQGILGNNMFAYCNNSPVLFEDASGCSFRSSIVRMRDDGGPGDVHNGTDSSDNGANPDEHDNRPAYSRTAIDNTSIDAVYGAETFAFYKGKLVLRHSSEFLSSWSICGIIFLNHSNDNSSSAAKEQLLKHEYGHVLQEHGMGTLQYIAAVFVPSATYNLLSRKNPVLARNYYNMPWEYDADVRGGVDRDHASWAAGLSLIYNFLRG